MRIFLAGATGAIGKRLVPLLLEARHHVTGTTRSAAKADALCAAGVEPAVVDISMRRRSPEQFPPLAPTL